MSDDALQPTMVGLGRMGGNMAKRLARAGFTVHGFDPSPESAAAMADEPSIQLHQSLASAVQAQPGPKLVWLMLPAGSVTTSALDELSLLLSANDIIVDGGNANYQDSQQRAAHWAKTGVHFIDCGVSGGIWGLDNGYCLMAGGADEAIAQLAPLLRALAPDPQEGWLHCGPSGAGHFTKMIHNGIEYGMMQAFAEGFALMDGRTDLNLDLAAIAQLWRRGSVVRSWLLDLTADALAQPDSLQQLAPVVADSGEGRWTVEEAIRQGIPTPVIAASLMSRFDSQGKADTTNKLLALMRKGFGGHTTVVKKPAVK